MYKYNGITIILVILVIIMLLAVGISSNNWNCR